MKTIHLDKKERLRAWFTLPRRITAGAALVLLLALPWAHDSVEGRFLLEPAQLAVIRAVVPGTLVSISADEGSTLRRGQPFLTMRNLQLESDASRTQADLRTATARAYQAELHNTDYGPAERERQELVQRNQLLQEEVSHLTIASPVDGTLLTPHLPDRTGSFVTAGTELAEVGSLGQMRARIYVPEFDLRKVSAGAQASLHFDTFFRSRTGTVTELAPASSEIAAGLIHEVTYKGIRPPSFYVATIVVDNLGYQLRPGMSGTARIYAERRSLVRMAWDAVSNFVHRKIW